MAKEAFFNILNNQLLFRPDLSVLDLFAGIGSISLEFASRGAEKLLRSVDQHFGCIRFINEMAEKLDVNITTIKE